MLHERLSYRDAATRILYDNNAQIDIDPKLLMHAMPVISNGIHALIGDAEAREFFRSRILGRDEVGWESDVGLYRRSDREQKWFFHELLEKPIWDETHPVFLRYREFIETVRLVAQRSKDLVHAIAREMDEQLGLCPEDGLAASIAAGRMMARVLCYLEDQEQEKADATSHFDRSGFTVHAFSTHPGLVLIDNAGNEVRVAETDPSKVAVFVGKKFAGFTGGHYGYGCIHGVRDPRRGVQKQYERRVALVLFAHPKLTERMAAWIRDHKDLFESLEKEHPL